MFKTILRLSITCNLQSFQRNRNSITCLNISNINILCVLISLRKTNSFFPTCCSCCTSVILIYTNNSLIYNILCIFFKTGHFTASKIIRLISLYPLILCYSGNCCAASNTSIFISWLNCYHQRMFQFMFDFRRRYLNFRFCTYKSHITVYLISFIILSINCNPHRCKQFWIIFLYCLIIRNFKVYIFKFLIFIKFFLNFIKQNFLTNHWVL